MKFSIVTPCYNMEKYLEETIKSIIYQKGDFEIEYIIIDGGSTDKSMSIIKKYEEIINRDNQLNCKKVSLKYISEKDKGMYDAINKGFRMANGDVCAYINADDMYQKDAFETIRKAIEKYPEIEWIKGTTSFANDSSEIQDKGRCYIYNKNWIQKGIYGRNAPFIHQDSVFWKKELWIRSGEINTDFKYAGDYELWIKFSKSARLWSINKPVSIFRKRYDQLSSNMNIYRNEQKKISEEKSLINKIVKIYFWLYNKLPQKLASIVFRLYPLMCPKEQRQYIEIVNHEFKKIHSTSFFIK